MMSREGNPIRGLWATGQPRDAETRGNSRIGRQSARHGPRAWQSPGLRILAPEQSWSCRIARSRLFMDGFWMASGWLLLAPRGGHLVDALQRNFLCTYKKRHNNTDSGDLNPRGSHRERVIGAII